MKITLNILEISIQTIQKYKFLLLDLFNLVQKLVAEFFTTGSYNHKKITNLVLDSFKVKKKNNVTLAYLLLSKR